MKARSVVLAAVAGCAGATGIDTPGDADPIDGGGAPPAMTWSVELAIGEDGRLGLDGDRATAVLRANVRDPRDGSRPLCEVTYGVDPAAWAWEGGEGPVEIRARLAATAQRFGFVTDATWRLDTTCGPERLDEPWASAPELAALRPWADADGPTEVFVGLGGPLDPSLAARSEGEAPLVGGLLRLPEPVATRDGGPDGTDLALVARRYRLDAHGEPLVGPDGEAWAHDTTLWVDGHPAPGLVVVDSVVAFDPR